MKTNVQIIAFLSIVILSSAYLSGCKKMDDTYRQFVEKGETIYIAKADSVKIYGGRNKAKLTWLLLSDPKVSSYKIYWNNRQDSIGNTVQKTLEVDTVKAMLTNMAEGNYFFEIYLYDKLGNSSVKSSTLGRVYGDRYQASLLNRACRSFTRAGNNLVVEWMPGDETIRNVELEYRNIAGTLVKVIVPTIKDNNKITLIDVPVKGTLTYRTVFEPEKKALDLFYTDYTTVQLTL